MSGSVENLVIGCDAFEDDFSESARPEVKGEALQRLQTLYEIFEGNGNFNVLLTDEESKNAKSFSFLFEIDEESGEIQYSGFYEI